MKKVAFVHSDASVSRMLLVWRGSGPSSKVRTTSLSLSGNVSLYWNAPMRACSRGSTTMVRATPNASGGHSPAAAVPPWIVLQKSPSSLCEIEICNDRIGARGPLNRCCAFAPDLESMLRDTMLKILLQHNPG